MNRVFRTWFLASLLAFSRLANAQVSFDVVHAFAPVPPFFPRTSLVQATDGNIYGTTSTGGTGHLGTIFRIDPAGNVATFFSFNAPEVGSNPSALSQATDGLLYGTSSGAVFKISLDRSFSVIHSFDRATEGFGGLGLLQASDGNFYGLTTSGGASGAGLIFRLTPAGVFSVLHTFQPAVDGSFPDAGLIQATDGRLYGTASSGGPLGGGTAFAITTDGTFTLLHAFQNSSSALEGYSPRSALVQGTDGNFYGTTSNGGLDVRGCRPEIFGNQGTIFRMTATGVVTPLTFFGVNDPIGSNPVSALIQASDGSFYGTVPAPIGGSFGAVFRFVPGALCGTLATVHAFGGGADGSSPTAALLQASDGALYGTTPSQQRVGEASGGTIFKVLPTGGAYAVLHRLTGSIDGALPYPSITQASDGTLYGTSFAGGSANLGTVFKLLPGGAVIVLADFPGSSDTTASGAQPSSPVIEAIDGDFYGRAYNRIFKITPAGALSAVHLFSLSGRGRLPEPGFIQAADGNFYGALDVGPVVTSPPPVDFHASGSIYRTAPDGSTTILYYFKGGADGANPTGLLQAIDGDFYGLTLNGGTAGVGTAFKLTPSGVFTLLHTFAGGDDGAAPRSGLVQASDGNFYGTTSAGGAFGDGTIFRMTPAGVVTILHSLKSAVDGSTPTSGVIEGSDHALYGTASAGGPSGFGTAFRVSPDGTLTMLHAFTAGADGANPSAALLQARDGSFYGTALRGGTGTGVVFRLSSSLVTLSTDKLTFGSQPVNTRSASQQIVVRNTGSEMLDVSSVQVTGAFSLESNTCSVATAPGSTCALEVTFTPTTPGASVGALTIVDDAPGGSQVVMLSGSGGAGSLFIHPPSPFGSQSLGTTSGVQPVLVRSVGDLPVRIGGVATSGDFSTQFHTCPSILPAGATCTAFISFSPTVAGTREGRLTISSDTSSSPSSVDLTGVGIGRPSLSFGLINRLKSGSFLDVDVLVTNSGSGAGFDLTPAISLKTLVGSGAVTIANYALTAQLIPVGGSANQGHLRLFVPATVRMFQLTVNGVVQDLAGNSFNWTGSLAVFP